MTKVILQLKQLSDLTCKNLEKRLQSHYELYLDAAYVLQCAVFVLVRNAFSTENFSCLAKESICTILLEHDPAALTSVRHLCVYFSGYFSDDEWEKVKARLFNNEEEYLKITEETRLHTEHLQPMLHSGKREAAELMNIVTTYRDEAGKKHRWTLKNVDPCYSVQETNDLLRILNTLTIFQKEDGTRRFTELVRYIYHPTTPIYDSEEEKAEKLVTDDQAQLIETKDSVEQMKPVNQKQSEMQKSDGQPTDAPATPAAEAPSEQLSVEFEAENPSSPDESSPPKPDTKQPPKDPVKPKNSDIKDQVKNRLMGNLPGWHGETKKKKKKNKKPKNSGKKKKGRKKK